MQIHDDIEKRPDGTDFFWSYRRAYVEPQFTVDLNNHQWALLSRYLERNGHKLENHICWKAGDFYYQYSDYSLYVGTTIVEKRW